MVKKIFLSILGACIGIVIGLVVAGLGKIEGTAGIVVLALGALFGGSIGSSIAGRSYEDMEDAVHGKPGKAIGIWLFWLVVIIVGIVVIALGIANR